MESPELLSALRSRFGRLTYDPEGGLPPESLKRPIRKPRSSGPGTSLQQLMLRVPAVISPGRSLLSPDDPDRPKDLDGDAEYAATERPPSHRDEFVVSSRKPEEPVPNSASNGGEDVVGSLGDEFDVVLELEDGLNEVARELNFYEARRQQAVKASREARLKAVRDTFAKLQREADDRVRVAAERAAEERRLRRLEEEKREQLWRVEKQVYLERLKKSVDSKAEELRTKTENFEEELNRERNLLRKRFDELIRLEKLTNDKMVEVVRKSTELVKVMPDAEARVLREKLDAMLTSAKRSLDTIAARRAGAAPTDAVSDADLATLKSEDAAMDGCLRLIDEAVEKAAAKQRAKEEEAFRLQQQQQQQQQQQPDSMHVNNARTVAGAPSAPTKDSKPLRISPSGLKLYAQLIEKVEMYEEVVRAMTQDASLKTLRFQLQKAVNIPINAISNDVSSNFREMTQKLSRLLAGEAVEAGGGTTVAASRHQSGVPFCMDRVAAVFVRQAEDQIASKPDAAFPMAAAILSLWMKFPEWGGLFLGKLYHKCPYLVPFYPTLSADVISGDEAQQEELLKAAEGRVLVNGVWEDDGQFFKRMGGLARLLGAIVQTPVANGKSHPFGPDRGWRLIADTVQLEPKPGVTATILADFLITAGHRLGAVYGRQFLKLLACLRGPFREKLGSGMPVVRFEEVIEAGIKRRGSIPPPKGVLSITV